MLDGRITAQVSGFKPVPHADSHALATPEQLEAAEARVDMVTLLKRLPVPRGRNFWMACLVRAGEMAWVSHEAGHQPHLVIDTARLAARRELKVWLSLHPKQAWFHRRFKTARWMFAKDGDIK